MKLASRFTLAAYALAATVLPVAAAYAQQTGDDDAMYLQALQSLAEGRKNDASKTLSQLIDKDPLHAGAWLDLALIQCELGNRDEAERLFAKFETRFSPNPDILRLVGEIRDSGCKGWKPTSKASTLFGRGIDQNVNQGTSATSLVVDIGTPVELPLLPEFRPQHDQYTAFGADYVRELTPNGSVGFVQYQARRNDHLHNYDTQVLAGGADSAWRFGSWALHTGASASGLTLGGRAYQRQVTAQLRVTPPLRLPHETTFDIVGSASHAAYPTLANFNSNQYDLRGQFTKRGDTYASASFGLMSDQASQARPGGNRHGSYLGLTLRRQFGTGISAELTASNQTWHSATPYAPELLLPQVRAQHTETLRAALTWSLTNSQALQLEARAVRNKENISIFQYNTRQLQLSWLWRP
jgi:tetratricopeptide (TPR) repeat protein